MIYDVYDLYDLRHLSEVCRHPNSLEPITEIRCERDEITHKKESVATFQAYVTTAFNWRFICLSSPANKKKKR